MPPCFPTPSAAPQAARPYALPHSASPFLCSTTQQPTTTTNNSIKKTTATKTASQTPNQPTDHKGAHSATATNTAPLFLFQTKSPPSLLFELPTPLYCTPFDHHFVFLLTSTSDSITHTHLSFLLSFCPFSLPWTFFFLPASILVFFKHKLLSSFRQLASAGACVCFVERDPSRATVL